jgi:hypothetical protein
MKVSELCKMIEDSIRSGRYPLDDNQMRLANLVSVTNRSLSSDNDLKSNNDDIEIEVRIKNLYVLSNYIHQIEHLPGIIEMDILDSFRMICRRLERMRVDDNESTATISGDKLKKL